MLDICLSFFDYLNLNKIRYCHWKSNSHLEEALNGKTDLDILVHSDDKAQFNGALKKFSIKRIMAPWEKTYPGLEDYLGFDEKTGSLIHLHVHYKLVMGQKFIKNHHLPLEEVVLNNLIKKGNVFVPCPEVELILLIIRAHMKIGIIDLIKQTIKDAIGRSSTPFASKTDEEFYYLIDNSNADKMIDILRQFKLPLSEELFTRFISKFSDNKLKCNDLLIAMFQIFIPLRNYRRQKNMLVYFRYSYLYFRHLPGIRKFAKERKMILPSTGKSFSFIGADGSGKSTLVKDMEKWLSWRLSVIVYYYGIPKTILKNGVPFAVRWFKRLWLKPIGALLEYLYMVYLARRRYNISQLSNRDVLSGNVVLTDRFPLKDFHDMKEPMDGPQLLKYRTKTANFFSKIESDCYEKITYPDMVFVLQADINELRRRKSDLPLDYHMTKADAVNAVKANERTVLVDANKPYFNVQLEVKRKIWELL